MRTELELNEMILGITNKIRTDYPELLKYLNEMPVTIPNIKNPEITVGVLASYYDSLVDILDDYVKYHNKNVPLNIVENSSINEIANADQSLLIEVNDIFISYIDVGVGNVPVVFLHGFPFDKSTWHGQIEHLKSTNRVIAIDIRGFGKSTNEDKPLTIDLFSEDLLAFMDKLNIEKAILCGLSMGGYIALNAVKRFPNRFEALVLCDTQCIADTDEGKENRYKTIDEIKLNGTKAFIEKFVKNVFHPNTLINKVEVVENLQNIMFANSNEIFTSGLAALAERSETCSTLGTIDIPTLIICGREDKVTPLEQSEFMNRQIKNSSLKIIENSGHVSNLEQPDAFNAYLLDFLNDLKQ